MSALAIAVRALLDDATVVAIVATRVHAIEAPQGTAAPAAVVNLVSEESPYILEGSAGWQTSRVSVQCLAETPKGAVDLGEAVRDALKDVHLQTIVGHLVSITKATTDFTDAAGDRSAFRRLLDFYIQWK